VNLHAKQILDNGICERCHAEMEDRNHVFFNCPKSAAVWSRLRLAHAAALDDVDLWNADVPEDVNASLWPFILQAILWRLWDARNGEIFRHENPTPRSIVSKICDDLVTWRNRFRKDRDVTKLNVWRQYLLSCNSLN
jgi:hypothetical protein